MVITCTESPDSDITEDSWSAHALWTMTPLPPMFPPSTTSKLCELLNRISFRDQRNKKTLSSNIPSQSKGVQLVSQDFYKFIAYTGHLNKQDYIDP